MFRVVLFLLSSSLLSCSTRPVTTEIKKDTEMIDARKPHLFLSNLRECMELYHDETICENKVMRSCHEDLDLHDCGKILLQVKERDVLINNLH